MLPMQRREKIKDILTERKSITALELATIFDVTNETIRRDLIALENEGYASRVHGGVYIEGGTINEIDISLRQATHPTQKQAIASLCAKIIQNGDSIFLDSSTTCFYIAELLSSYRLTVLTSSVRIIEKLSAAPGIRLLSIGGNFDKKSFAFYGTKAIEFIRSYHVDKAFLSCRSANFKFGVMDASEKSSEVRRAIIAQSDQSYLCMDSSKFGLTSFVNICDFSDLTGVITDQVPSQEWADFLKEHNVTVLTCDQAESI